MSRFKATVLSFSLLISMETAPLPAAQTRTGESGVRQPMIYFEVSEAAGIRRRSDVVSAELIPRNPFPSDTGFRLIRDGAPVPCQFRFLQSANGEITHIYLDFVTHFEPWEKRRYTVETGPKISSEEPSRGLSVEESAEEFFITYQEYLAWTVRKDLAGLLSYIRLPDVPYVDQASAGLGFRTQVGKMRRLSERRPTRSRILREGPIACALEFTYSDWPPGASSKVTLEFVRSKSWAHVTWSCGGGSSVTELSAELRLILEGDEHLFDFGAGEFVYNTLTEKQQAVLEGNRRPGAREGLPAWVVFHGTADDLQPLFQAAAEEGPNSRDGWVHLMDGSRCTAAAVADFGSLTNDRIELDGTGLLRFTRSYEQEPKPSAPSLEFWVHFVRTPVHLGARTSPQAMRAPLKVRWLSVD